MIKGIQMKTKIVLQKYYVLMYFLRLTIESIFTFLEYFYSLVPLYSTLVPCPFYYSSKLTLTRRHQTWFKLLNNL